MTNSSVTDQQRAGEEGPDVWQMGLIHRALTRSFQLVRSVIPDVATDDTERRDLVLQDLQWSSGGLHHHHKGEDEKLWPLLLQRAAAETATVLRMPEAHERIDGLLQEVRLRADAWGHASGAGQWADTATALTDSIDRFLPPLIEHLDEEERLIVPLLAQHITRAEWEAFGKYMGQGMPRNGMVFFTGSVEAVASAQEFTEFMAPMPWFVRGMWKVSGRKQYAKHLARITG